jgi:APA family basic amino acid/polyamine antiporter
MFYSLAVFAFVPGGSVLSALVLSGITMTFLCIVYAGLIAVMPRAGGDYVWQTRILDGIPGSALGALVFAVTAYFGAKAFGTDDTVSLLAGALGAVLGVGLGWKRGGIGFVLSATGWWFILALWAPIYGAILNLEVVQPLVSLAGWTDGMTFFTSQSGTFAVSLFTIVLASGAVALGMAGYARVQRWCI